MTMIGILVLLLFVVVINLVGIGLGIGRQASWAISLALFAGMLAIAGWAIRNRWDGVFIDRDNRISLARYQLVLWTILLVSALFTAGLTNAVLPATTPPAPPPLAITIPPQIWALLGLGAFTAVAAPAIKDGKRGGGAELAGDTLSDSQAARLDTVAQAVKKDEKLAAVPQFDGHVLTKSNVQDARWIDLIKGDYEGSAYVDVSKLQKLAFTMLLVTLYGSELWKKMAGTAFIGAFPGVNEGFLALLAISHAAYLADKQIAST